MNLGAPAALPQSLAPPPPRLSGLESLATALAHAAAPATPKPVQHPSGDLLEQFDRSVQAASPQVPAGKALEPPRQLASTSSQPSDNPWLHASATAPDQQATAKLWSLIRPCWGGLLGSQPLEVRLRVRATGALAGLAILNTGVGAGEPARRIAAIRAVRSCAPYPGVAREAHTFTLSVPS